MTEVITSTTVFSFLIGLILGGALLWVSRQRERESRVRAEERAERLPVVEESLQRTQESLSQEQHKTTELQAILTQERSRYEENLATLKEAREELSNAFQALSAKALERNNRSFMDLAKVTLEKFHAVSKSDLEAREKSISDMIHPLKTSLGGVDQKLQDLEKERVGAYRILHHQVKEMVETQKDLRLETANLVKALRTPHVRGRWGEMQLRRVVEVSGMSAHCDFVEQVNVKTEEGALRPDMIVNLPGGKQIIIDAKAPLSAYLDALEAKDETLRTQFLKDHARQVKTHILQLSSRGYWDQLKTQDTPEFVVLFLPGETFFSAALEHDPSLIELGVEKRVILATPATLIALLHAVAYGWRQEKLTQNAREISALGKDLYKRLSDMGGHMTKLGQNLNTAVNSYNKTVGTLEARILPSARRFKDLEVASGQEEVKTLAPLEHVTRTLQAPELIGKSGGEDVKGPVPEEKLKKVKGAA